MTIESIITTHLTCSIMTALRSEGIPLSAWLNCNASRPYPTSDFAQNSQGVGVEELVSRSAVVDHEHRGGCAKGSYES